MRRYGALLPERLLRLLLSVCVYGRAFWRRGPAELENKI